MCCQDCSWQQSCLQQKQLKGAEATRSLYASCKYPPLKDFKFIVQSSLIAASTVTVNDIENAQKIWGDNIAGAALKGKTIQSAPPPVVTDFVKVPKEILEVHKEVTLSADVFFVIKIPFLLTISKHLCYTAVSHLADQKIETIFKAFKQVFQIYSNQGFHVSLLLLDGEFASLQAYVHNVENGPRVNLTSANEHVPEAERQIQVVKARVRATRHDLSIFTRMPQLLVIHMVFDCVQVMNYFPTKGGLSISPRLLMTGVGLNAKKHFRVRFGAYWQVHEQEKPQFLCRNSGRVITRYNWTEVPMPGSVI
jgi:hypothetical protein